MKDVPVEIKWSNKLPDKHLFPVDHTLHGTMDTPDVRTVVHLHGANVEAHSDGHPEAWFTRNFKVTGEKFTREVYEYTNHQTGATIWYHDHAIGITRLNVYAGLAGFYLIRDQLEDRLNLPRDTYEIPLMIQDKVFNEDGSLFYPNNAVPPVENPVPSTPSFFFGNTIAVNGKLWPYLEVEPRKYRFRILNASNLRAYGISLSNGGTFHQIGTELGLLHHPVEINSFVLEPAERIDVIIDFSKFEEKEITLVNGAGSTPPADENTNIIMKFKVTLPLRNKDTSTIPQELLPYQHIEPSLASRERTLHLDQTRDSYGRALHLLNNRMWSDPVTEKVELDTIEIWHLVNHFLFPHPIHVHLVHFEILGRKPFTDSDFDENGNYIYIPENLTPPLDFERGLKDVVRTTPGEVTTIAMHFKEHVGDYIWHCHILEHEDNDMMRPLKVIESPTSR
ncbi:multicopper oxidase [Clostridium sp.]|uniref:multicopper oxidase family protein n=1 Tax=Clostridium sp. TaxID=1506 RepID=UPI002FC59054